MVLRAWEGGIRRYGRDFPLRDGYVADLGKVVFDIDDKAALEQKIVRNLCGGVRRNHQKADWQSESVTHGHSFALRSKSRAVFARRSGPLLAASSSR